MPLQSTGTKAFFTDDLGQPLIGGKVYTYAVGTSTPKAAYQTSLLQTPHTNPIILDDAGSVNLYLNGGYRLRVFDANDVFVDEVDNLYQGESGFSEMPEGAAADYFRAALDAEIVERKAGQNQLAAQAKTNKMLALAALGGS